jgi:hypothetical protein
MVGMGTEIRTAESGLRPVSFSEIHLQYPLLIPLISFSLIFSVALGLCVSVVKDFTNNPAL